jgi:hypothetical protein
MPQPIILSKQHLRDLIASGSENRNLDYKQPFSWSNITRDEKLGIVKDVLAFANTRDGGVILIGVEDKTNAFIGLSEEEAGSFDQTSFNDFVHKYTDPQHTCYLQRREIDGKRIVAIVVPEFEDVPVLCKQTVQAEREVNKIVVRKAGLYKRTDKATSELIENDTDMRELLNRGILRRQDELMYAIRQILLPTDAQAMSDTNTAYVTEIQDALIYFGALWSGKLLDGPHWTLTMRPVNYAKDRIPNLAVLQNRVQASAVSLRGWTFPIVNQVSDSGWSNFSGGSQSSHQSDSYASEAIRAYQSGLIIWTSQLWEDSKSWDSVGANYGNQKVMSFISAIFSVSEWCLFAQRYFESLLPIDESIHFEVTLTGAFNRLLISADPLVQLAAEFRSKVDFIEIEETVSLSNLRTDPLLIARGIVRKLFELFNWNNPTEEMLANWQQKLINRQF